MTIPENVTILGSGAKNLVIIPGLSVTRVGGDPSVLKKPFGVFLEDFTVYFMDRRDEIPEGCTSADLAEHVWEDMQACGVAEAGVIGVSQGGMIAQFLAANHPGAVSGLVLAATIPHGNPVSDATFDTWMALTREGRYRELNHDMFSRIYSPEVLENNASAIAYAEKVMRPDDDERFLRLTGACRSHDADAVLGRIKCPALVAGGRRDAVLSYRGSEELASVLGCRLLSYDDSGHAFYDEIPGFYHESYDFLK